MVGAEPFVEEGAAAGPVLGAHLRLLRDHSAQVTGASTDEERIEEMAAGLRRQDTSAFEAIYREFARTVLAYLVKTIGDRAAAEDVHQQVFAELWGRGPAYDPARGGLFTFIMTLARSRAIDHLRKRVPEPREPETAAALADRQSNPVAGPDQAIDRWQVVQLLGRLPAEEVAILRQRFYEGLSQREIAESTGIPLGTVKMRMAQGLRRLREMLDAEEAMSRQDGEESA